MCKRARRGPKLPRRLRRRGVVRCVRHRATIWSPIGLIELPLDVQRFGDILEFQPRLSLGVGLIEDIRYTNGVPWIVRIDILRHEVVVGKIVADIEGLGSLVFPTVPIVYVDLG